MPSELHCLIQLAIAVPTIVGAKIWVRTPLVVGDIGRHFASTTKAMIDPDLFLNEGCYSDGELCRGFRSKGTQQSLYLCV